MIKPELGMPVIYVPHKDDHWGDQPLAATIARVFSAQSVTLMVVDASGLTQNRHSVLLWQPNGDGDFAPVGGRWCKFPEWFLKLMAPHQVLPARPTLDVVRRFDPFNPHGGDVVPTSQVLG